jgi:hypothetical protein
LVWPPEEGDSRGLVPSTWQILSWLGTPLSRCNCSC